MEFTQWTEAYSVGDPLMDAYHHIFFQTIHDLGNHLDSMAPEAIEERIAFLVNYASMHFDSEENLMARCGFPDLEAHRSKHQAFQERLLALQASYLEHRSSTIALQLLTMAQDWLVEHILGEDLLYKPYLKNAGHPQT
jgi:hemerythrin